MCPKCGLNKDSCVCVQKTRDATRIEKVLDFKTSSGVWVKGTVGYDTAYVWFEDMGALAEGRLKNYELKQLGDWCLAMVKELKDGSYA